MLNSLADRIAKIIVDITDVKEAGENFNIAIFEKGILDSMGLVQLLVEMEEQLGICVSITEFDREQWASVNKIASFLEGKGKE